MYNGKTRLLSIGQQVFLGLPLQHHLPFVSLYLFILFIYLNVSLNKLVGKCFWGLQCRIINCLSSHPGAALYKINIKVLHSP